MPATLNLAYELAILWREIQDRTSFVFSFLVGEGKAFRAFVPSG